MTPRGGILDWMLSPRAKEQLLRLARQTLDEYVTSGSVPVQEHATDPALNAPGCAFVSLHGPDGLRGCIGTTDASRPLWQVVREVTTESASKDPRFDAVRSEELDDLELEISVLTPFERIRDASQVRVGIDGLQVRQGRRVGLLLPQVAERYKWTREEFLRQTYQKAGLPENAEGVELFRFQAEVFALRPPPKIVFACPDNSCASPMSEALARTHGWFVRAYSGGVNPAAHVHPATLQVLREKGLEASWLRSKPLDQFIPWDVDYFVMIDCEYGPVRSKNRVRWDMGGAAGAGLDGFRTLRDRIETRVLGLLEQVKREVVCL